MTAADASTAPARVSVVIPVYNQADFVVAAIDSVLAQDYPHIDLTVVDDGSTDATPRLLAAHPGTFTVLTQPNRGAAAALNRGIRESRGEFVCWLSADDLFLPGKVTRQVEAFGGDPELGLVYTGYERIRADGASIIRVPSPLPVHPDPFVMVFWQNSINGSSVMVRREVFETCGAFDESLRADVDGDMWLRLTQRYDVRRIDGVYLKYRVHDQALSANRPLMVASLTEVRRRYLRSGVLQGRLAAAGKRHAARTLAWMAADFAERGLDELGRDVLREARLAGREPAAQMLAGLTIGLAAVAQRSRPTSIVTRPFRSALQRLRRAVAARA
jgi:teichuronic acid biosynthesis glycosyltransferase TuaG